MKLLVFGASGATGIHVVRQALAAGHQVTAFVRDPSALTFTHPRLKIVKGNVADAATVRQAMAGQEAVLSALGANSAMRFDPTVVAGMAHIVQAMTDQQVNRLIYLSTIGVRASRREAGMLIRLLAPTLLRHEIRGHEEREVLIKSSALHWTIVRAPILTNGRPTQQFSLELTASGQSFAPKISRADVATGMLSQLTNRRFLKKAVALLPG